MKAVHLSPFHMYHTQIMSLDINLDDPSGVDSFNNKYSVPELLFFILFYFFASAEFLKCRLFLVWMKCCEYVYSSTL